MRIDNSNGMIINSKEIYVHDDYFNKLIFDHSTGELQLLLTKFIDENSYTIRFVNTVGFEMTSCDYWGKSLRILDFQYLEDDKRTLLPKLHQVWESNQIDPILWKLGKDRDYMELVITFISGDILTIACESIIIE